LSSQNKTQTERSFLSLFYIPNLQNMTLLSMSVKLLLSMSLCPLIESFVVHPNRQMQRSVFNAGQHKRNDYPPPLGTQSSFPSPSILYGTAYEEHAVEVFSLIDADGSGHISKDELTEVLRMLDIDASKDDISALFKHLDRDGNGEIELDEFLSWYKPAASSAESETNVVMNALKSRRTVNDFDTSPVPDSVFRNAIEAAIHAPCHGMTEPWRFIQLGEKTISTIAALNAETIRDPQKAEIKKLRWEQIPGWCVITSAKSDGGLREQEDYAATCCAVQNFMLAMHVEGVGTKWTTGPITRKAEFAELCGINPEKEQVVGVIWYGFASGGLASVGEGPKRKRSVDDVLSTCP
jgi:nitroreductase